jgi:hypothetical protein
MGFGFSGIETLNLGSAGFMTMLRDEPSNLGSTDFIRRIRRDEPSGLGLIDETWIWRLLLSILLITLDGV